MERSEMVMESVWRGGDEGMRFTGGGMSGW